MSYISVFDYLFACLFTSSHIVILSVLSSLLYPSHTSVKWAQMEAADLLSRYPEPFCFASCCAGGCSSSSSFPTSDPCTWKLISLDVQDYFSLLIEVVLIEFLRLKDYVDLLRVYFISFSDSRFLMHVHSVSAIVLTSILARINN